MNFEEQLQKAATEMKTAEEELLRSGLPKEQWSCIKQYMHAAIFHFQLVYARALNEATAHRT
jgi:hypothetical protein